MGNKLPKRTKDKALDEIKKKFPGASTQEQLKLADKARAVDETNNHVNPNKFYGV
jgi:hypothetical protein